MGMLDDRNIKITGARGSHSPEEVIRPFKISRTINSMAYELGLPHSMKRNLLCLITRDYYILITMTCLSGQTEPTAAMQNYGEKSNRTRDWGRRG